MSSMLSFVLKNKPIEWENVNEYNESYKTFNLQPQNDEYKRIENMFKPISLVVNSIQRVQNPFQYGRFKLRQEMVGNVSEETVFHIIHESDLEIALKYTCDYRRYTYRSTYNYNKQPTFYCINDAILDTLIESTNKKLLVVSKIPGITQTQSDYYIQYIVDFKI